MKLSKFWMIMLLVFFACALTAYSQRGYFAIGGEWLIPYLGIWHTIGYKIMERKCCWND